MSTEPIRQLPDDRVPGALTGAVPRLQAALAAVVHRYGHTLMRAALGLVFVWFGALKLTGETPVAALVAGTLPWADPDLVVPALGIFEVVLGVGLLVGYRLRIVGLLIVAHLAGTFLTLIMQPDITFAAGNPLLLTTEGEFVVKNLVLISAGLVIAAGPHRADQPAPRSVETATPAEALT